MTLQNAMRATNSKWMENEGEIPNPKNGDPNQ